VNDPAGDARIGFMPAEMLLRQYRPRCAAKLRCTSVARPRFPVIDAHNHLGCLLPGVPTSGGWHLRPVRELLEVMDEAGVSMIVDLDGQWDDALERELDRYSRAYPERFAVFAGVDYDLMGQRRDFGSVLAARLRRGVAAGARGLKVCKWLGLRARDPDGRLIAPDDRRLDELWAAAGELGVPVLIHVADPVAFFQPLDEYNERWEELVAHPDWHFHGPGFPAFDALIDALEALVARHPRTTFITAHVGCNAEDLDRVSAMLQRYPNMYSDISARLAELGRKPYSSREFFVRHADRLLFGTDMRVDAETYRIHYRFLETRDEYFHYGPGDIPAQGRWMIYGLGLPDDVLRKVYSDNARRLLKLC